jgi:hypothetical protein
LRIFNPRKRFNEILTTMRIDDTVEEEEATAAEEEEEGIWNANNGADHEDEEN